MSTRIKLDFLPGGWYNVNDTRPLTTEDGKSLGLQAYPLVINPYELTGGEVIPKDVHDILQDWGNAKLFASEIDDMLRFLCWFGLQETLTPIAVAFYVRNVPIGYEADLLTIFKNLQELDAEVKEKGWEKVEADEKVAFDKMNADFNAKYQTERMAKKADHDQG
jgi:hypothetical protein